MYETLFPNISETALKALTIFDEVSGVVLAILLVVASWHLFKKFGEKPWKAFIPFYNTYIIYKRTWKISAFWIYIISSFAGGIMFELSEHIVGKNPGSVLASVLALLSFPLMIVEIVYSILFIIRIAEAFGKSKIFTVFMILFYEICLVILGLGKSKYLYGKTSSAPNAETEKNT